MTRRACLTLAAWALVGSMCAHAADGKPAPKPTAPQFPDVDLVQDSKPRYAALACNPWHTKAAYILFDGNVEQGYRRAYVWVPDDPSYRKPQVLSCPDGKSFKPLSFSDTKDKEKTTLTWHLSWTQRKWRSGGRRTRFDYATGKTVVVSDGPVKSGMTVDFGYAVNYTRGPVGRVDMPLDVVIRNRLGTIPDWSKPPKAIYPWEGIEFRMTYKRMPGRKGEQLFFKPSMPRVSVRSLPPSATVTLDVRPYLEDPVLAETIEAPEAFAEGFPVDLEYGWYNFDWKFECPGLGVRYHHRAHRPGAAPYAFARPTGS